MALSSEDKQDVSKAYGKALANKVAKVTRDRVFKEGHAQTAKAMAKKGVRAQEDLKKGNYVKLKPTSSRTEDNRTHTTAFSPYRPDKTGRSYRKDGLKESPERYTRA